MRGRWHDHGRAFNTNSPAALNNENRRPVEDQEAKLKREPGPEVIEAPPVVKFAVACARLNEASPAKVEREGRAGGNRNDPLSLKGSLVLEMT